MEHDQFEGEWNDNCRGMHFYCELELETRAIRKPPYFSIEVHHGGTFCLRPTKKYIGGKVQTVHGLDTDYISLLQLEAMAQQFGYDSHVNFYYKIPGYKLDVALVPINNDKGVLAMLKYMDHKRTVVISDVNVDVDANVNDSGLGDIKSGLVDMVEGGVEDVVEDDSSTDDEVYYSDHSYAEQDDDELYETYVDEHGEFVKVRENNEEVECEDGGEIILSDADSKYD
ncbi:hypothetical protein Vadar_005011 [Vaccinium darrowii]|uniref:Uncharacterized protein n=1 Tax=Vaccinium darrowii TaxID=229202 RepID=A0ACB7XN85_9ERIC|nr:hypothetical protein Vadar_005011 [Vaccinium darrowii]